MSTEAVELEVSGRRVRGALALPAGEDRRGALIVCHEWWGLNDEIKRKAERFAAEGFLALAVDLYEGQVTDQVDRARALVTAMKTQDAVEIVRAAVGFLSAHARSNGKAAVTGFCLGGAVALAAAGNVEGLSAIVPFYGTPKDEFLHYERMRAPIQGHYAKNDQAVSAERIAMIRDRVNAAGGEMELFFYEGGHAFMREGSSTYHTESAELAWSRVIPFLRQHLGLTEA